MIQPYIPERIVVDRKVEHEPFVQQVLQQFPHIQHEVVESYAWHKDEDSDPNKNPLTQGKRILHLKHFPGISFKACPGTTEDAVCCNYFTIDFIENCPLECTYCILQAFLNKPVITIHANIQEILEQVRERVEAQPQRFFRVGTGEHSDSLALDPLLRINDQVIPFFGKLKNAVLEVKTKTAYVDHLLDLPHQGNTVLAWSINPAEIVEKEEHKTARLHERLAAAKKATDAGYKVAFHFDPLIYYPEWEKGYDDLIEQLVNTVPMEKVAWVSIGALRYIPKLKTIVEERFPKSSIFLGEFVRGEDGKMRYAKKVRQRMFQHVRRRLHEAAPDVTTYLCMEKAPVWQKTMSITPKTDNDLDSYLNGRFQQQFNSNCASSAV